MPSGRYAQATLCPSPRVYYLGPRPWVTRGVGIKRMRERHCPCRGLRLIQVPTTPFPKILSC